MVNTCEELLLDPRNWTASPEGLNFSNFSRLDRSDAARLEVPFTEEEVHVALTDLNGPCTGWDKVYSELSSSIVGILLR